MHRRNGMNVLNWLDDPRGPLSAGAEAVGLSVVYELLFGGVVFHVALQPHADVGGVHRGHGAVHDLGVGNGEAARLDAVKVVADVAHRALGARDVVLDQLREVGEQGGGGQFRLGVTVRDRDPAFGAFVAHATGAVPPLVTTRQDHLHSIGEDRDHAVAGGIVDIAILDGGSIGGADGHLALGESMGAPFADATGVEIDRKSVV